MRLAFFVEGSNSPIGSKPTLLEVWSEICASLGVLLPTEVFPIDKRFLVAMDPSSPPMSGNAEGLDDLLLRMFQRKPFDAALVLWDLCPPWLPEAALCRWKETISLYAHMEQRHRLPAPFQSWVSQRHHELTHRPSAKQRRAPVKLTDGAIVPVCMEPEFESWLLQDEAALRAVLGLTGQQVKKWPTLPKENSQRRKRHLTQAICAAQSASTEICKKIRGDWRTNQPGWTTYLCRSLASRSSDQWAAHPLARRLKEVLPPQSRTADSAM